MIHAGAREQPGTGRQGAADMLPLTKQNLAQLKQALEKEIAQQPKLAALKKQIEITITPEGLRIELLESKDGTFFETGSAVLNGNGRQMLTLLARELGGVPNRVSIEGHTDSRAYAEEATYGNWELSSDRANAARRLMEHSGLHPAQISQVRGFADRELRVKADPLDPSNRRIFGDRALSRSAGFGHTGSCGCSASVRGGSGEAGCEGIGGGSKDVICAGEALRGESGLRFSRRAHPLRSRPYRPFDHCAAQRMGHPHSIREAVSGG